MMELFKFFKNALKAIFLSPYYILFYIISLIATIYMYIYGEITSIILFFGGSGYHQEKFNEYDKKLKKCKKYNMSYDLVKEKQL